jgi:hypothetical protein
MTTASMNEFRSPLGRSGCGPTRCSPLLDTPMLRISEAKPNSRCARLINSASYRH